MLALQLLLVGLIRLPIVAAPQQLRLRTIYYLKVNSFKRSSFSVARLNDMAQTIPMLNVSLMQILVLNTLS